METYFYISALVAAEVALLTFALSTQMPFRTRWLVAINMILVSVLGSKLLTVAGNTTNIANVYYATVVVAQAFIYRLYGEKAALDTIRMTYFALISAVALMYLTSLFPTVPGNEEAAFAVDIMSFSSFQIVLASFVAFMLGQTVLVHMLRHTNDAALAVFFTQAIDSIVFFPLAFYDLPVQTIITFMLSGLFFKILVSVPLWYGVTYLRHLYDIWQKSN